MKRSRRRAIVLTLTTSAVAFTWREQLSAAQHEGHAGGEAQAGAEVEGMGGMPMEHERPGPLGIPMSRHGSGTAWLPDASPMSAIHLMARGWRLMLHGNLFAGYDGQASDAGDDKVISVNWLMGMASHELVGGELTLRSMLSLEPLTVGKSGYPLLLQTGETFEGRPLVDRQHPHDLFMEVAASYTREVVGGVGLELYGGPAAEPALGPVAYPHRPSAMADPMAPITHHWLDSTHITYGVATAGVLTRFAKLEGSWFNGREPDENRYDFDLRGFDSWSVRLSVNPHPMWSAQISRGWLESPEQLEPDVSVTRTTASIGHSHPLPGQGSWDTTLAWGRNHPDDGPADDAGLLETAVDLGRWGTTFARGEVVRKRGHDFGLEGAMEEAALPVGAVALGHVHPLVGLGDFEGRLGARAAVNFVDEAIESRYGTDIPFGAMVYLQVIPTTMAMSHE
jgi:hypothetical protein